MKRIIEKLEMQKNIEKVITLGSTSFRDLKTNERGFADGIRMAVSGSGRLRVRVV